MTTAETTTLIKVECVDQVLRLTQTPTIASGGVKEDTVEFAFDSLWDGFNLAAVFYRSENEVYHVEIVDNRCIIPKEVLANPGYFYLGVMGAKDGSDGQMYAYTDAKALIEWALGNFALVKICTSADVIGELPVSLSKERNYVTVAAKSDVYAFLPEDTDTSKIARTAEYYEESLTAPVRRGTEVGELTLTLDGKVLGTVPLITKLDAEKSASLSLEAGIKSAMKSKPFAIAVSVIIALAALFTLVRIFALMKKAQTKK